MGLEEVRHIMASIVQYFAIVFIIGKILFHRLEEVRHIQMYKAEFCQKLDP